MVQVPPWHTSSGLIALASDAAVMLEAWLADTTLMQVSASPFGVSPALSFPATEVDTAVGKWLMGLASAKGAETITSRLQDVQRQVRRRY